MISFVLTSEDRLNEIVTFSFQGQPNISRLYAMFRDGYHEVLSCSGWYRSSISPPGTVDAHISL